MPGNQGRNCRKGRRRRQRVMSFLQPCLLLILTRNQAHGYSLLDELAEFGFDPERVDPSLIYRALHEMEDSGWVSSRWDEDSLGPKKRVYQILPDGQTFLTEWVAELRRTREEIDCLLAAYEREIQES